MILVLPFYNGDRNLAVKWSAWVNELGPYPNHQMLIVRDHRAEPIPELGATFGKVEELIVTDDQWNKWPESPNNMFQKAARHIEYLIKKPWLWMEVDAWALSEFWLDRIENGYMQALKAGKPFVGARVDVEGVPVHMSGIGVYPGILTEYAGEALMATDIAWDVYAAKQIVPRMHETGLIAHSWDRQLDAKLKDRKARFEDYQSVVREVFVPHPDAVIYHADKTGSICDLMRQARGTSSVLKPTENQLARPGVSSKKISGGTVQLGKETTPSRIPESETVPPVLSQKELIEALSKFFVNPLAKGRIIKSLKAIPVKK